ncbi:death on curing protein [Clostridium sartagoforme AAU1]|uniref:Death on curing protein n=2 Tax=root TaxID=1 RepID=R9BSK1_9CLOT|nr:type II toxin-antitoxin system death-on-curing family toxin [Clostridium sartagoforme]EOR20124.1 death on curing protein [Clostridium sartagoforme AAU1]
MKNLTIEDIIYINKLTIRRHGGTHGIKNISLIESSLNCGVATFDGEDLYPTLEDKISMISYSFIKNHGFNDGNKRVGCIVLLTLCYKNNIAVKPSQQDLINLGLGVASGVLDKNDIRNFILKN